MPVNGRWPVDHPLVSITLAAPQEKGAACCEAPVAGGEESTPGNGQWCAAQSVEKQLEGEGEDVLLGLRLQPCCPFVG